MSKALTTEQFIIKARKVHGDRYGYSKSNYINNHTKVIIQCSMHGDFLQRPYGHYDGKGCPFCAGNNFLGNVRDFIFKANEVHNNRYDYSKVVYTGNKTKVMITCPIHGNFKQTPNDHLRGRGCRLCKSSKAELFISKWLDRNGIKYETQKTYNDLNSPKGNPLRFDFYLPDTNTLLEFDGEFHFEKIFEEHNLKLQQLHDEFKNKYCEDNNINLVRINYKDILEKELEVRILCQ